MGKSVSETCVTVERHGFKEVRLSIRFLDHLASSNRSVLKEVKPLSDKSNNLLSIAIPRFQVFNISHQIIPPSIEQNSSDKSRPIFKRSLGWSLGSVFLWEIVVRFYYP